MKVKTKDIVLSALFLTMGVVLPIFTGQIPQIGNMLLPMHIPVLLCGLICGWKYGLLVGFITPLLRSFIFLMPPLYPVAIAMAFELATYGFVIGLIYNLFNNKSIVIVYLALIISMIIGRLVWGGVMSLLLKGGSFTFGAFVSGALLNAIPGIVIQLLFIPLIMIILDKVGVLKFKKVANV